MMLHHSTEGISDNQSRTQVLLHKLIPAKLLDNHDTGMKSVVLILTLVSNIVICLGFLPFLHWGFDKTPAVREGGELLLFINLGTYVVSFILLHKFAWLNVAGNLTQMGVYIAGVTTSWMTGGIFSPMLFLLLIPPVFAFVVTNIASGITWAMITVVTFLVIWGLDEFYIAFPQQVIIDAADFSKLCIIIPLLTCVAILTVVAIYEINSIRLKAMLAQERNMFAFKASHDALTGLANRAEFNLQLKRSIESAEHSDFPVALVYIDLDGFKPINDTIGHHAGDVVLEIVSKRLKHIVRGTDTVARLGGDEFAIILQGVGVDDQIEPILQKVLDTISQEIKVDEEINVQVRGSLGISYYPNDAETPDRLCRYADMAMYLAKEQKGIWRFYHEVNHAADGQEEGDSKPA